MRRSRELTADIKSGKQKTDEHWLEKYTPIANHIDDNAGFDLGQGYGSMFETFGEELEFVHKTMNEAPKRVWKIIDCEGESYLTSGFHLVNRMGYIISKEDSQPEDENIDFLFD